MRTRLRPLVTLLFGVSACSGGGSDDGAKAKMASELVSCKNDKNQLKIDLAEAKAELQKAKEQLEANATVKLDPLTLAAKSGGGAKHIEGNIPPEAVMKVVKQNSSGFRVCYEHALKRKPD